MPGKFKEFNNLGSRQKRRRLENIRCNRAFAAGNNNNERQGSSNFHDGLEIISDEQVDSNNLEHDNEVRSIELQETEVEGDEEIQERADDEEETADIGNDEQVEENYIEEEINVDMQNREDLRLTTLRNVLLSNNFSHSQGNKILKTLRTFPFNLNFLPKNIRSLLKTPASIADGVIANVSGGEYLHLGFKDNLIKKLNNIPEHILLDRVIIDFNIDGGSLHKSGKGQFWPIQFRIFNISDKRPLIAGVFKGDHKPKDPFEFLKPFVTELRAIHEEGGIMVRNKLLPLHIRCFIADAPARAFILNHYGHTSKHACSKCKVEGHHLSERQRGIMTFTGTTHVLRTDEDYKHMIDEDHHKGPSPLTDILGLVSQVPFESLDLIYLGCMKEILTALIVGKYSCQKLSGRKMNILDSRMAALETYCPSDFNRRLKKFTEFNNFEGTEYRQLLLYTAPSVMNSVISDDCYQHLLILHCVVRLLHFTNLTDNMLIYSAVALEKYVSLCEVVYGEEFLSYNVHGLLHMVADVKMLGPLDTFSAFCYENNMPAFRQFIRKQHLPLQQFHKRMCELNNSAIVNDNTISEISASKIHVEGPLPSIFQNSTCRQYKKIQIGSTVFSTSVQDNCCVLKNVEIVIIRNIVKYRERIKFIINKFQTVTPFYNVGYTSDVVGINVCKNISPMLHVVDLSDVQRKCYRMPKWSSIEGEEERMLENEYVCATLLSDIKLPDSY